MPHKVSFRAALLIAISIIQASAQQPVKPQEALLSTTAASPPIYRDSKIVIGPGDLLQLSVFDEPEMAQSIRVSDGGSADLMLLGSLHLAGLSTSEAQSVVENLLRTRNFLLKPHVALTIQEYGTQGVSVLGEVKKPGVYPFLGSRNLLDILSQAGGTTPIASNVAMIKRRSGKQEKVTTAISNNPDEMLASQVELQPGDTVIVPRAGIVYVLGDVGHPGGFVMQNNGAMTLVQAVAYAAGVNRTGSATKTRIVHKNLSGYTEQTINLKRILEGKDSDLTLTAEDIVYVPPSILKNALTQAPAVVQAAANVSFQAIP